MNKTSQALHTLLGLIWQKDFTLFGIALLECALLYLLRETGALVFFFAAGAVSCTGNLMLRGRRLPHTGLLTALILVVLSLSHVFSRDGIPFFWLLLGSAVLGIFMGYRLSFWVGRKASR